jgi:phosphatidyl-myo-inositol dimannoside synthase
VGETERWRDGDGAKGDAAGSRVLLITDKSLPQNGGSQMVFHNIYRQLPPGAVTMLTRQYPGAAAFDKGAGYAVRRVPFLDIPKARMPLLWTALALAAPGVLRRFCPDQIHCGQALETGTIARWCKRLYGLPYVLHTFSEEIARYRRGRVTGRLLVKALREADAITTVSQFCRRQLIELGVDPSRIHMLYPGVAAPGGNEDEAAAVRSRHGLEGRKVLLTIARLAPRKGQDRVIRALPRVAAEVPSVVYLVVGTGSERGRLEDLARACGVADRVIFTGSVASTASYYQASDVFVMPNRVMENGDVEGFGIVFLEANSHGVPVIGGRSGGTEDAIVHGETGWLVDPEDESELTERILQLLSDSDLARQFGEAGRRRATEFTWERAGRIVQRIAADLSRERRP